MVTEDIPRPESGLWKDYLNRERLTRLAERIGRAFKRFDQSAFLETLLNDGFFELELKERITAIADCLREFLPDDYARTLAVFRKIAPDVGGFENWALMAYIEKYGLDHFEQSVAAMKELTQYSTAEFAIRPYMIRYTKRMLEMLAEWVHDPNEHVRRLAAEGSRPRGVWTAHVEAFKKDPRPVIELLEHLKADPSLYVRKAVANNLNDISKENPDLVISTAVRWQKDKHKDTDWIIKRACRSLIKQGDPRVFGILGYTKTPRADVLNLKIAPGKVKRGSKATITFDLVSQAKSNQKLVVDYRVHYLKKTGRLSPKVFKLAEKSLRGLESIAISTKHSFEEQSTRKHFPGKHRLEIMVNGRATAGLDFDLVY